MRKSQFITLLIGVAGGLAFALGMCMCLLPEWNALSEGRVVTAAGLALLLALGAVGLVRKVKSGIAVNWRAVGKTVYGAASALVFGAGMCMVMVWHMTIHGVICGAAGIVLLLFLIPICAGFKQ